MTTETEAVSNLVKRAGAVHLIKSGDSREFLVAPEGAQIRDVSDEHGLKVERPRYVVQTVTLQTAASLVEYVNRFKTTDTLLFADMEQSEIVAVVDYHSIGDAEYVEIQGNHCTHRATMKLPFSQEWAIWKAIDGKLVWQLDFARFVEENAADIAAPSGGELLDAVRDLQAHRKVNFIRALRTASDNENFEFTDETEARTKGGIELPTRFRLSIPVYFGEEPVEVHAFLRWKLADGNLTLGIALHRSEHVRQSVFRSIMIGVSEKTERPVLFGKPA